MKTKKYQNLLSITKSHGAAYVMLLDPDRLPLEQVERTILSAREKGVDVFFVGGTLLLSKNFDE
ncbi:MAG: geranylgeranylglyceryl/heptaprenylglyceryl phosphate synthase, partial [Bacteroidales bacterium]|nr:geranylgeranylglyceryl/heptaprenylglyceryl phosphate synthase [Bacteroidales bacterium]